MRKTKLTIIALAFVLVLTAFLAGCGASSDDKSNTGSESKGSEVVKIGFLGAKTGGHAIYGLGTLKGMKMAVDEVNAAGGVLGKTLQIVEDDHGSKLEEIPNVVSKYIERDKVVAIIGDPTTGGTKTAAAIANDSKVVLLSAGSTGPGVVEIGEYIFRNTLLDTVGAPATMDYAINEMGWKNVAVITSINNDYSVGLTGIFKEGIAKHGGTVVIEENIQDGDTDFSAIVTKIKGANPDVIVFSGYYTEGGLIMKEVRRQGMEDVVMVGGDGLQGEDFYKLGEEAVIGSISYAGFSPVDPTPTTAAFIEQFKTKNNGEEPDLFSAQGYDAVMLIVEAMKKANSTDPVEFHKTLAQIKNFDGVSGVTTFQDNREPKKSPVYLLSIQDNNGQLGFDLLRKVAVE